MTNKHPTSQGSLPRGIMKGQTDLAIKIESHITKKPFSERSDLVGEMKPWDEYKKHVGFLSEGGYIFRGQREPWKLRTTFHRRKRYDLWRFSNEDIPKLHLRLVGGTKHVFNLRDAQEYGAFLSLTQHHGFPTPLLDWTYSSYVAAFLHSDESPENQRMKMFGFSSLTKGDGPLFRM